MAQGWSSLPADLVNRVADCLLVTNDLACYSDMHAVCHHWRSVTADPRSNQHDPRFRPSRWVMLDEHKVSSPAITVDDGGLLFVNTATGRFLRRSLALLRDPGHAFVTSTTDGLLVLADKDPPHAVSVLNPFTGSLIRFVAPLPDEPLSQPRAWRTADVVGSSPTLVLVSVVSSWVYWAEPQSESFSVVKTHRDCPACRLPLIAATVNRESTGHGAKNIIDQLRSEGGDDEDRRCYTVVAAGGDMLAVSKRHRGIEVFRIDAAGNVIERVRSIGSQALFLGVRCLVVDTDCFPTVEPNCVYFQHRMIDRDAKRYIYKFSIGIYYHEHEPELVSAGMSIMGPWTLTQLLCNYTMDIPVPGQTLTWERRCSNFELDCEEYIDFVDDYSSDEDDYGYSSYDHDYSDFYDYPEFMPDDYSRYF